MAPAHRLTPVFTAASNNSRPKARATKISLIIPIMRRLTGSRSPIAIYFLMFRTVGQVARGQILPGHVHLGLEQQPAVGGRVVRLGTAVDVLAGLAAQRIDDVASRGSRQRRAWQLHVCQRPPCLVSARERLGAPELAARAWPAALDQPAVDGQTDDQAKQQPGQADAARQTERQTGSRCATSQPQPGSPSAAHHDEEVLRQRGHGRVHARALELHALRPAPRAAVEARDAGAVR
jgi:hypothetical protein